tara:strand:- start:3924 stop:4634 length:711 start_codon:yes stop_codon:yes gene_type:complete
MKFNKYLGLVFISLIIIITVVFSHWRNNQRDLSAVEVVFSNNHHDFLNVDMVNKLLIQNQELLSIGIKDTLALSSIEAELQAYPIILNAEVYISLSRVLTVSVEERIPLLRIVGDEAYYLDAEAVKIPLTDYFTSHVPLFFGSPDENQIKALVGFIQKTNQDDFLKREIIQIEENNGEYLFKIRSHDFIVEWGNHGSFEEKNQKLKILCKYLEALNVIPEFKRINLKYKQQVIASS